MQINGPSHLHGAQSINAPHANRATQSTQGRSTATASDEVQISSEGNYLAQVHDLPEVRADRVASIQAQIANGSYETDEKINVALDRLLDEFA